MRLTLIGMPGSGKSTLGRIAAKYFHIPFIDADNFITDLCKMRISKIFELVGEKGFRDIESKALEQIFEKRNFVLATGGGMPCFNNNMERIKEETESIYLNADEEELFSRLRNSDRGRPLMKNMNDSDLRKYIRETKEKREAYYRLADFEYRFENDFIEFLKQHF